MYRRRFWIGLVGVIVCPLASGVLSAQVAEQAAESAEAPVDVPFFQTPFGQIAPPLIRELIGDALFKVEIRRDEHFIQQNKGSTGFSYKWDPKYRYRYSRRTQDGRKIVKLTPHSVDLRLTIRHRIQLPPQYESPRIWKSRLMRHELDHFAISNDPRARMLMEYLCENIGSFDNEEPEGEEPSKALYNKWIGQELNRRGDAIVRLLGQNYELLDSLTRHGNAPLPNRSQFFQALYTRENLDAMGFPYLEEATPLLGTSEYQSLHPEFIAIDPTVKLWRRLSSLKPIRVS